MVVQKTFQNKYFYLHQFRENASDGPDINLGAVLGVSDKEFWSSVPSGRDIVSEVVTRSWKKDCSP